MSTAVYSTKDYPTYATLKRAHPEIAHAFCVATTWFATIHGPYVIGYKPNQHRQGIRIKKNRGLGKPRRGRRSSS